MIRRSFFVALLIALAMIPMSDSAASNTAGMSTFEEQYQTPESNLELKGVGLLKYLGFIKAYAGALYLEEGTPVTEALYDRAKRIEVEYLRPFKGKDFGPATVKMMEKNVEENAALKRLFFQHYPRMKKNVGSIWQRGLMPSNIRVEAPIRFFTSSIGVKGCFVFLLLKWKRLR